MSSLKNKKFTNSVNRLISLYGFETQTALAEHFGISLQAVQQWSSRGIPGKYVARASKEKNVSVDFIENGTGPDVCVEGGVSDFITALNARIESLQKELDDKRKQIDSLEKDKIDLREERDFFKTELKKATPTRNSSVSKQEKTA